MKLSIKRIEKILKRNNIEVYDKFYFDKKETLYGFMCYKLIIHFDIGVPNVLFIEFHLNTEPEYVAYAVKLFMNEFKNDDIELEIMESFSHDKEGNFLTGDEAYQSFEKETAQETIDLFMKDQTQKHFLCSANGFRA